MTERKIQEKHIKFHFKENLRKQAWNFIVIPSIGQQNFLGLFGSNLNIKFPKNLLLT